MELLAQIVGGRSITPLTLSNVHGLTDLASALRVIFRLGARLPLGQAVFSRDRLIAPLHVIDERFLARAGKLQVRRWGTAEMTGDLLSVLATVPAADAAICAVQGDTGVNHPLAFAPVVHRGDRVDVHFLEASGGGSIRSNILSSLVRDLVVVDHYMYSSAAGSCIILREVGALFLAHCLPRGMSGAVTCLAGTEQIVGFVHGNAAENDGAAICLDPRPLIASLGPGALSN